MRCPSKIRYKCCFFSLVVTIYVASMFDNTYSLVQVLQACELYKAKDKDGRSFGLLHCWNILQHEQKWKDRCSQKR